MFSGIADKDASSRLTLKEAALLAGVSEKAIRHELSGEVIRSRRSAGRRRQFGARELFYFRLVAELPFELKKADRKDLFELIVRRRTAQGHWTRSRGRLVLAGGVRAEISTMDLAGHVVRRLRAFLRGKQRMVSDPGVLGGEPVFGGTRISVRHVGQLVKKGVPEAELLEDFPALKSADLEFARMYVELGRPPGRPKKLKLVRGDG